MSQTAGATIANADGASVVDATRTADPATVVDDDDDDDEYEWYEDPLEQIDRVLPVTNPHVSIDAVYEPVGSPKSITNDPPVFGSEEAFMRAQLEELRHALRAQERLLRWQQDLREQEDALRSTADMLRAAHTSQ